MSNKMYILDAGFKSSGANSVGLKSVSRLACAKNDAASFQIAIDTNHTNCRVNLSKSPSLPISIGTPVYRLEVVSEFETSLYPEGYLNNEHGVSFADILNTSVQYDYSGGELPVIWTDVKIPKNAAAKEYKIIVNLYTSVGACNETRIDSATLNLEVKDFVMPYPEDYKIYVDLWQHNSNLARYYGVALWSDEHFEKMELMVQSLSKIGQKSVMVLAGDCPWQGWGCYLMQSTPANLYEYSIVLVQRAADGKFTYDFTALKRYVKLCEKYNICGDITIYGLCGIWKMPMFVSQPPADFPEKVLIRYIDQADGCAKYMDNKADIVNYIKALFEFLKKENLFHKTFIGADEPSDTKAYSESIALLRDIEPNVKLKMAIDHAKVIHDFSSTLYSCASSFPCSVNEHEHLMRYKKANPDKQLLWYVCNIPDKPNTVLKSTNCQTRFIGSLNYHLGFDGFLRWAHYCWTLQPTKDICYNNFGLPAGDVCFVYPSKSGGIMESVRYRLLKKGIEDFELLRILAESGCAPKADEALGKVLLNRDFASYMRTDRLTNDGIYSDTYADYENMREFVLDALVKCGGKKQ